MAYARLEISGLFVFIMAEIDVQVRGLIQTQRRIEQAIADLHGEPVLEAMRDSTLYVQRSARVNSPVDTGRLRASITPSVTSLANAVRGVVGSNVAYAPYMELGTRPHWTPRVALETWARRHGMSTFIVMRAIARRGLKPRRYLQRAFESNKGRIVARFERAVNLITRRANNG